MNALFQNKLSFSIKSFRSFSSSKETQVIPPDSAAICQTKSETKNSNILEQNGPKQFII